MKILLAIALTVLVLILLMVPFFKKYRGLVLILYAVVFLALNALQTFRTADLILPFYHAKQQTFYQEEFAIEGQYPDALLQIALKDKKVYMKDDLREYLDTHTARLIPDVGNYYYDDGKLYMYGMYHQNNIENYLKASGITYVCDEKYNDSYILGDKTSDFEFAGHMNDMFRYLFPLHDMKGEHGNAFFFYWYYSTFIPATDLYINTDGLNEADEVVLLWDDNEAETFYLMSMDYYNKEVAGDE